MPPKKISAVLKAGPKAVKKAKPAAPPKAKQPRNCPICRGPADAGCVAKACAHCCNKMGMTDLCNGVHRPDHDSFGNCTV